MVVQVHRMDLPGPERQAMGEVVQRRRSNLVFQFLAQRHQGQVKQHQRKNTESWQKHTTMQKYEATTFTGQRYDPKPFSSNLIT